MNRDDFLKLVSGGDGPAEYLPVAFLLNNGYACAGYYHAAMNEDLSSTCVLLNARLIELRGESRVSGQPSINDFNEFLEEVVAGFSESKVLTPPRAGTFGKSIPLTAIPYEQIAVVYPVAHISALTRRAEQQQPQPPAQRRLPTFFDLDKSEIIQLLRTKLW